MSVNQAILPTSDTRQFRKGAAEFIILEVSKGASLIHLHQAHPELVPEPMFVNRWRDMHPDFDLLMDEAERARAELLMEQTIDHADDTERNAAQARNSIAVRQKMAATLDRDRYGKRTGQAAGVDNPLMAASIHSLTDDQLLAIAAGALEGTAERVSTEQDAGEHEGRHQDPPAPPPEPGEAALSEYKSGTSTAPSTSRRTFVTSHTDESADALPKKKCPENFSGEGAGSDAGPGF